MSNKGLLRKALKMNGEAVPVPVAENNDVEADRNSGISPEDRKEINAQIDELTKKNRIAVGPERFVLKPLKKGFLFPLMVNLLAFGLTAGALWGLSSFFSSKDEEIFKTGTVLASAEGKLIQELKRDSESRLSEKDKEISDFQARLSEMEKEQAKLQASFESRFSSREAELREQMKVELEKERQRLIAEGLSDAVIQERLKKFEEERLSALRKELSDFQRILDSEKAAAEANYNKLRDEYRNNINNLNEERKRIQDDAKKREEALRASMEAKTQELEAQSKAASAGLEQAKAEIARIEEQRKSASAAEDRIVGLYLSIRTAFQERRFDEAAVRAAALRAYLNDPGIASIPTIQKRQSADLFAADTLAAMAKSELDRASADTAMLLSQAESVSAIRTLVANARTARNAGQDAAAGASFAQALEKIPEVLEAHAYFTQRASDENAERRQAAAAALNEGIAAADKGDYVRAASSFAAAARASYLSAEDTDKLVMGITKFSVDRFRTDGRNSDTRSAQTIAARAKREMDAGRWREAISAYSSILNSYPQAEQAPESFAGIETALVNLSRDADRKAQEDTKRIKDLETEVIRLTAALQEESKKLSAAPAAATSEGSRSSELEQNRTQQSVKISELERLNSAQSSKIAEQEQQNLLQSQKVQELERLLEETRKASAIAAANASTAANQAALEKSQQQSAAAAAESAAKISRLEADMEKLRQENLRMTQAAQRYDSMLGTYTAYRKAEDAAMAKSGSASLVEARNQLDTFLTDTETRRAFPDLRERIARYEREFVAAGQKESLFNAAAIAENALRLRDAAARETYFKDLAIRYSGDANMQTYIDALKRNIR